MRTVQAVLTYLSSGGVQYLFGIPAGSVNAFFDELNDFPEIQSIVAKHETAASYMASAYAKETGRIAVCIGASGPGATNFITGAANAMREHLPVLFITGNVPVQTIGLNASQELDAEPLFRPVTKYSVTVKDPNRVLSEISHAVEVALSDIPGPVHVAVPIDVQLTDIGVPELPPFPTKVPVFPDVASVKQAAQQLAHIQHGVLFVGQGARGAIDEVLEASKLLGWPIVTTPQAKGFIPTSTPLASGVFGFAGHVLAGNVVSQTDVQAILIIGSSLGETATSNYNRSITQNRFSVQIDIDPSVFGRLYEIDLSICGDATVTLQMMIREWRKLGVSVKSESLIASNPELLNSEEFSTRPDEFNTRNILQQLQTYLPNNTRYTVDIGEFMSYVIHYMQVFNRKSFEINVHFGPMGVAIGSALGLKLADSNSPVVCITGDGCFFMHGLEILTAKEHHLPILFVVFNNARLGMVYHGHMLQYGRSHQSFEQTAVNLAQMGLAMGIPTLRVENIQDLTLISLQNLLQEEGPALLEIALVDNNIPPMGDRVKFLSSFGS
ncbi:thiamine pyrophosphate-binding protein [Alicyclobacillaceae bacterium I2511]|nr:thiamine pyrophosphate-binding protein [Alicyclobacillaceae bacterium I2511]